MASYLIGVIVMTCFNLAAYSLPIREVTDYYQESLEDIIRRAQSIGAVIPESATVAVDDQEDILKIVKDFIGSEADVKRTLFLCKDGLCDILNGGDFNGTDGIIKAQRKKLTDNTSEEKIKEIFEAKENEVLSLEATHNEENKDDEDGGDILSMPKLKLDKIFKVNKYLRVNTVTEESSDETTPSLPVMYKFKFPKTRVPLTSSMKPKILYEDTKVLMPETLDEMIRQYQMYPGAGCVYVKGCDGSPIKIIKSPKAMALIAKIYRELAEEEEGHKMMTFYLQKYEPQHVYFLDNRYTPPGKLTSSTTTTEAFSECFMY